MSNADIRGQFIWHELMTTDTDAAAAFYPKVLPWKTQASGQPGYTLWYAGRTQAGGLMSLPAQSAAAGSAPHWLVYIGTPSVDSTVAAVQQLGGKVLKSPADIPGIGRFAVVSDPQGAGFALYTPASGAGDGAQPPAAGAYSWHELATSDPQAALDFYTELFGWEKGRAHDMGGEAGIYQMISHGGRDVGGIYRTQQASTAPSWLTYVQVADIDRAVSAAGSGGGRVLNGPHQVPGSAGSPTTTASIASTATRRASS